jgi:uncharacterized protein
MMLPKGTLLNTLTVALGGLIGWLVGAGAPSEYQEVALSGLGLVTMGIGIKMFLSTKNALVVVAAIALGGIIGVALGIQFGIEAFAAWAQQSLGGGGRFAEAIITTSILFCVGPMTLLGCLQEGLEGKIELLAVKSTMDGVAAFFFAAAMGPGVLVTAAVVLVVQSALTFSARPLRPLADDKDMLAELSAVGGAILLGIGLGLLGITRLPMASYLPALFLAPLFVALWRRWRRRTDQFVAPGS